MNILQPVVFGRGSRVYVSLLPHDSLTQLYGVFFISVNIY